MGKSQLYEIVVIFDPHGEESDLKRETDVVQSLIEKHSEEFIGRTDWGMIDFVYPIKKRTSGYYVYYLFKGSKDTPALISSALKMDEKVLRYLIVRAKSNAVEYLKRKQQEAEQVVRTEEISEEVEVTDEAPSEAEKPTEAEELPAEEKVAEAAPTTEEATTHEEAVTEETPQAEEETPAEEPEKHSEPEPEKPETDAKDEKTNESNEKTTAD